MISVDGPNLHYPRNPWNDLIPLNTNKQWFQPWSPFGAGFRPTARLSEVHVGCYSPDLAPPTPPNPTHPTPPNPIHPPHPTQPTPPHPTQSTQPNPTHPPTHPASERARNCASPTGSATWPWRLCAGPPAPERPWRPSRALALGVRNHGHGRAPRKKRKEKKDGKNTRKLVAILPAHPFETCCFFSTKLKLDTTIYKLQCSGVFHVRIPAAWCLFVLFSVGLDVGAFGRPALL